MIELDLNTGALKVDNELIVSPNTLLNSFIKIACKRSDFKKHIMNIPYRSYIISKKGKEYHFYFYMENLISVSITLVPYFTSQESAIKKILDEITKGNNKSYYWGDVKISEDRFSSIFSVDIEYYHKCKNDENDLKKYRIKIPEFKLIPYPMNKEGKKFLKLQDREWVHEIGTLPDWLYWEIGPVCPQCYREMMFYAKLTIPNILKNKKTETNKKNFIYIFLCYQCKKVSSIIH